MIVRTVLDCRSKNPKFYISICLLVASWVATLNGKCSLEVIHVGALPKPIESFFQMHGVLYRLGLPDPELAFVPTGNSLLGATSPKDMDRILLVDNDVVFLNDHIASHTIPDDTLAGAIAGAVRLSPKQWDMIESDIGLPTLDGGQVVDKSVILQTFDPSLEVRHFPRTYINGGVLLLPKDSSFVDVWKRHILLINKHFEGTRFQSEAVCRSNMAGLATAAAAHGKFEWLDASANFRDFHFLLNTHRIEEISVLHMTGDTRPQMLLPTKFRIVDFVQRIWRNRVHKRLFGKAGSASLRGEKSYVSGYVQLFWDNRVLEPLSVMEPHLDAVGFNEAHATAHAVLKRLEGLVQEYDLDSVMHDTIIEVGM